MSRYEALLVRAALAYLVLTGLIGMLFYLVPVTSVYFRVTHVHLGVIGFFLSFVMGVAYWLMPRPGGMRQEGLEAATFYLLNGGLLLRLFVEPAWRFTGHASLFVLVVIGGILQLAAMLAFAFAMHGRVKTADAIRRLRSASPASPAAQR